MRLYGAAMIRNEADIVEAFVRHNLTVLDGLAIVDHGSCDGTSEILASLVAEGLPIAVSSDATAGLHQSAVTTRLVREVFLRNAADFVFVIDADEFIKVRSRGVLETALSTLAPRLHAVVHWQTYIPDFAAVPDDAGVRERIAVSRRLAQESHGQYKVIVARHLVDTPGAVLATGNHKVLASNDTEALHQPNPHALLKPEVAAIAHVPVRSRAQFTAKIVIGWLAILAARLDHIGIAFHWRDVYEDLRADRELTADRLTEIAVNYSLARSEWRRPDAVARVTDPFLADFELRYEHLGRRELLPILLAFAERLAAAR